MAATEYVLELISVFHTGPVEPGTCMQKLVGNVPTGVILKDVSIEVHGGELMAILGSKGSGKRALLEVISRRAQGPTRGQILLNHVPMSLRLFQESCCYVTHKTRLLEGLSTKQTLYYAARLSLSSKIGSSIRESRVKQVLADLALTQVANRPVEQLTLSEYRRLVIGVQLIKDPIVLLLDEPAWGLDPLNTYFVISILSNHAKKYNRIVLVTMEKPRSDIFPFLDRAAYLCLGDIVYTGSTRMMLDYFRNIGFPCPELENPLMYYLCLSTVDRRSRERFIDSNNQIAALVERFKLEGAPYRKYAGPPPEIDNSEYKVPLSAYGRPGVFSTMASLFMRSWAMMISCGRVGMLHVFLRLMLLPCFFFLLWNFYWPLQDFQRSFQTRGGLLFNCIAGTSFLAAAATSKAFAPHRTRYYHEAREGLYRGPLFILTYVLFAWPVSYLASLAASAIIFFGLNLGVPSDSGLVGIDWLGWIYFSSILWCCWTFVEQQTIALMMLMRSSYHAAATSIALTIFYIVAASASLRSLVGMPDWLYYLGHIIVYRYASAFLHQQMFMDRLPNLPVNASSNPTCPDNNAEYGCRYRNGSYYLLERYHFPDNAFDHNREDLLLWINFGLSFAFVGGMMVVNLVLYLVPLPAFIKAKFRD
ncbi:ATP-binding cassette sub-family G member 5 [Oratosquilla oratoria]|uniref:ATP-binding cassette sub-family G member 5 n=1 Tax=Oratosquilla oratoria TaxID=337810 RepID=UPI003F761E6D